MQHRTLDQALKGKRLLIFDFDGTLADTSHLHAAAFADVLAPFGVLVDYPAIAGRKTRDALIDCFQAAGLDCPDSMVLDALVHDKQAHVRGAIGRGLQPLPGVERFLAQVQGKFRLALVSSGSHGTVLLALQALGFAGRFDPLICAEDVSHAKPDPEGFLKALSLAGCQAHQALIFEDSDAGFAAAEAAGIDYVNAALLAEVHGS